MAGADCHLTLRASTGVQFPARSSLKFRQAQFHCGNPPPAADPSILDMHKSELQRCLSIRVDLARHRNLFKIRSHPLHGNASFLHSLRIPLIELPL
jgi:hypothetical protein